MKHLILGLLVVISLVAVIHSSRTVRPLVAPACNSKEMANIMAVMCGPTGSLNCVSLNATMADCKCSGNNPYYMFCIQNKLAPRSQPQLIFNVDAKNTTWAWNILFDVSGGTSCDPTYTAKVADSKGNVNSAFGTSESWNSLLVSTLPDQMVPPVSLAIQPSSEGCNSTVTSLLIRLNH